MIVTRQRRQDIIKVFMGVNTMTLLLHSTQLKYELSLLGFNCTEKENKTSLATLRKRAWPVLQAERTAEPVILGKLRNHFEERFRYDEQGCRGCGNLMMISTVHSRKRKNRCKVSKASSYPDPVDIH